MVPAGRIRQEVSLFARRPELVLNSSNSMHSIFGRRQRMIRTETQHWIEEWITDHPEVYCYADGMLAASYPTGEMIINLRQSTPSYMEDDVGFRVMLHRTKSDIASWRERWFGERRESD
jgi:hypothetical protein